MTIRFSPAHEWIRLEPEDAGMSGPLLKQAVEFAKAASRDPFAFDAPQVEGSGFKRTLLLVER